MGRIKIEFSKQAAKDYKKIPDNYKVIILEIADRNLFSGDFVILSAAKDLQPFHPRGFSIRDSSGH